MAKLTLKIEYDKEENEGYGDDEHCYYSDLTFTTTLPASARIWSLYKAYASFAKAIGYSAKDLDELVERY